MMKSSIIVRNNKFFRLHVKTHVISKDDDIFDMVKKYAKPEIKKGDWLFISERVLAITQGRAYKISDIKVGSLAKFLSRYVHKSPYGIGLACPETMQLGINEAGAVRVVLSAVFGALFKLVGIRGMFYRLVGNGLNAIDGPCDYTLPPYNKYAVLGPKNPDKVAQKLADKFGIEAIVIDANDLGVNVLGVSKKADKILAREIFRDNPLGQGSEQTPMCLARKKDV